MTLPLLEPVPTPAPGLVASLLDEDRRGLLVLAGRHGDEVIDRVRHHLAELMSHGVRDVVVLAEDLEEAPAEVAFLLVEARDALFGRGILRVFGLRAEVLRP